MLFAGAVDSNDSFNSNLLIEPGQDLSTYASSSSNPPLHHLPPATDHLQRFAGGSGGGAGGTGSVGAPNPGGYLVPPRKCKKLPPFGKFFP